MNKVQKIAVLIAFHTQVAVLDEASLMLLIAWVVNGVDENPMKGTENPRIDWSVYSDFIRFSQEATEYETPDEQEAVNEPDPVA